MSARTTEFELNWLRVVPSLVSGTGLAVCLIDDGNARDCRGRTCGKGVGPTAARAGLENRGGCDPERAERAARGSIYWGGDRALIDVTAHSAVDVHSNRNAGRRGSKRSG